MIRKMLFFFYLIFSFAWKMAHIELFISQSYDFIWIIGEWHFVSNRKQVSKYWNILALDGSNWQKIDLFYFQMDIEVRSNYRGIEFLYVIFSFFFLSLKPFQGPVIENISQRCGGFLKYLSLKGCQSVGDQSIRTLAQHCHNIEHLDLTECKKISDSATEPLSKHCNKLTAVSLESCSQISDLSLKALSDGCPVSEN